MNYSEYKAEIKGIAANLACEAMQSTDNDKEAAEELINDSRLLETVDQHQWVIYYSYNDEVIKYSRNDEYYQDIYDNEAIGQLIAEKGINDFKTMVAFWCMYADVQENLSGALDTEEENYEAASTAPVYQKRG